MTTRFEQTNVYTLHDVQNLPKTEGIFHRNDKVEATEKLDALIDARLNEADRQSMRELDSAIASGDSKDFARAIERFRGHPEELKKFTDMLNKNLKDAGSGVGVAAYGENALIMGRDRAVEISTDGKAVVRNMERMANGLVGMGAPVHDANASLEMENIGRAARFDMLFYDSTPAL